MLTRQGDPAGPGRSGTVSADSLRRSVLRRLASTDWVNLAKVAIPQADEQQRLLANLIQVMNRDNKPLPRFWYSRAGLKADL